MTKKLDPDRPNKARRGRPKKVKPKGTNSIKLKAIWADPVKRAYMVEQIKAARAIQQIEREANPDKFKRTGTPNGMTRATAAPLWADARLKADRFIKQMQDEGELPNVVIPGSDEEKGVAALHAATVLALGPGDRQAKLAAIRTVLEWTKAKPASRQKIDVTTSEDWLAQIAADDAS
jgi:hypothetical protein